MTDMLLAIMWISSTDDSAQPQHGQTRPGRCQTTRDLVTSQPVQVPGAKAARDERSTALYHSRSRSEGCGLDPLLEREEEGTQNGEASTSGRSFQRTFSGYGSGSMTSLAECREYLKSLVGGDVALLQVADKVMAFHRSYIIVPGYHKHTSRKVAEWVKECRDSVYCAWYTVLTTTGAGAAVPKVFPAQQVALAVESCIMAGVHSEVFASLVAWGNKQDAELSQVAAFIKSGAEVAASPGMTGGSQRVTLDDKALQTCGVPVGLWEVDVSEAACQITKLEECACPLEMMQCLLAANEAIVEAVRASADTPSGAQVSGDELLPLFLSAVVIAQPPHLASMLEYLLCFHPEGDHHGRGGYQLAVLEASVRWLLQCHRKGMVNRGHLDFPDLPRLQRPLVLSPDTHQNPLQRITELSLSNSNSGPGPAHAATQLLSGLLRGSTLPNQSLGRSEAPSSAVGIEASPATEQSDGDKVMRDSDRLRRYSPVEHLRHHKDNIYTRSFNSLTEWGKPPAARPLVTLGRNSCDVGLATREGPRALSGCQTRHAGDLPGDRLSSSVDSSASFSSAWTGALQAAFCGSVSGPDNSQGGGDAAEDLAANCGQGRSTEERPHSGSGAPFIGSRPPAVILSGGGGNHQRGGLGSFLSNLKQSKVGPSSGHTNDGGQ